MIRYEGDDRAIARVIANLALADAEPVIGHGAAKVIAAGYNDNDTAEFVTTGAIPTFDDDDSDGDGDGPAEWLMDAIRHGVDSVTLGHSFTELDALYAYLQERVESGETGPVDGWASLDIKRHVDYPHEDGALPECWCFDESDNWSGDRTQWEINETSQPG